MRAEFLAEIVARCQVLGLTGAPTVELHGGDERLFNEAAAFPHIGVNYDSGRFGALLETTATTYRATLLVEIILSTADPDPDTRTGNGAGLVLLDELEAGLAGWLVPSLNRRLRLVAEKLEEAWAGRYQWVQLYQVQPLISS